MKTLVENHKGKMAMAGGSGLSIGLALYFFAPKAEVTMLRERLAEEHRDRMDAENQCEARFLKVALPTAKVP